MSSARIGVPPAKVWQWSDAHWLTRLAVARRPRQQHPSGAAAKGLAHRDELRSPAFERAEIPRQRLAQRSTGLALLAEPVEKQLVQDHRVHRDEPAHA